MSAPACSLGLVGTDGESNLERAVRDALVDARFDEVIDLGSDGGAACAKLGRCRATGRTPSVDVAVIAFPPGCPPVFANAMLSPTFEGVKIARIDPITLDVQDVRYRQWDQSAWDSDASAERAFARADAIRPDRAPAEDFVLPYPASSFKLLVAVKILELVDAGAIQLEDHVERAGHFRPLRAWLEDMITWSDDDSTEALVRKLHAIGEAGAINATFEALGLDTLQISGTSPQTGRSWHPGRIHMSAWDTARLLWLLDPDAPPPDWTTRGGVPVRVPLLSPRSRTLLNQWLHDQAFHDVLSTGALCGKQNAAGGIPALVPARWASREGLDARPCNDTAQVTFAHKTGLTLNFGSDVGIVRGIPGRAQRHYIITFFSNLGHRYADLVTELGPCHDLGICYTQRIAGLAARIDSALAAAIETRSGSASPP